MTRGMFAAGGAMARLEMRQEVIASNLANASTTGFRADVLTERDPRPGETPFRIGPLDLGTLETRPILTSGSLRPTGRPEDLAVSGEGFFVIQGEDATYLTRAGAFARNANGELVTADGEALLGEGGPITVESGGFDVSQSGDVVQNGSVVDRIRLVNPDPKSRLQKMGMGRFAMPAGGEPEAVEAPNLMQGYLEGSNVNAIQEMIQLVNAFRAYEANAKAIRSADDLMERAVSEVGRLA